VAQKQKSFASFLQKRRVFLFILLCMLPGVARAQKTTLSVGLVLEPPVLDPTINPADPIRSITNGNVFEGLTWIAEDGRVQPRLATGWSVSADGLTYTFHLRGGVQFQDGTKFDCGIVRFSYERAAAPGSINPQKPFFEPIARVACPSPLEAVITLTHRVGNLPYELAWPDAAMVAPATAATNGTHPVGTGPYAFSDWRRGDSVTLVRNDRYWGAKPQIQTVTFRFIADPLAATNALLSGELDAFPSFGSQTLLDRLRSQGNLVIATGTFPIKVLLALNEARKPFDDLRVRRALAYAIDRPAILQATGYPGATVIGSHMSPSDPDYIDLSKRYPYDPEKAKALLQQASVKPGFPLTITLPPIEYADKGGQLIAAFLGQVGINVTLAPVAWPQWLSQVYTQHAFQATVIAHVEPNDLDIYARPHYYFGYHNAEYDALFKQFQEAADPAERHRLSIALQEKLADDEPNIFLFSAPRYSVWNAKLHGMWVNEPISAIPIAGAYWQK
jgi:peptide/nickel transport system substrate-binding protein